MSRPELLLFAAAVSLLLTSCAPGAGPAEPLPEGSTLPTVTPTPTPDEIEVAESPFVPCTDADRDALKSLFIGDYQQAPTVDFYPAILPLPSCLFEERDKGTALILEATQVVFDELEATVAATQGPGVVTDGNGYALDGAEWTGQAVNSMYFVGTGFGLADPYIMVGFEREG